AKSKKIFVDQKTACPAVLLANTFGSLLPTALHPLLPLQLALGSSTPAVIRTGVPPFRQARFRNFRNRGLVVVRGVIEKGQARTCRVSKIDNIQRGRFLVEIIAVPSRIESEQRAQ